jgi:hypothetical protein
MDACAFDSFLSQIARLSTRQCTQVLAFLLESQKGARKVTRPARKRGGKASLINSVLIRQKPFSRQLSESSTGNRYSANEKGRIGMPIRPFVHRAVSAVQLPRRSCSPVAVYVGVLV